MTADAARTELAPMWVLEHAEVLAELSADPGPVAAVHARRAVAAAYYAVLHRLCLAVAWTALPTGSDAERFALCRSISHGSVDSIARWLLGAAVPPAPVRGLVRVAADSRLITFAGHTVALQWWRTRADYDHVAVFGRPIALLACRSAREAIAALDAEHGTPAWGAFSSLILHRGL